MAYCVFAILSIVQYPATFYVSLKSLRGRNTGREDPVVRIPFANKYPMVIAKRFPSLKSFPCNFLKPTLVVSLVKQGKILFF